MKTNDEVFAYESDKVTPFIYKTNNLEQFNNYDFNRDLDLGHVRLLANRIKDFTLCPLVCTYDNDKLFILDGQHRLEVAKRKNSTIYYRIIDNVDSLDIASLQVKKNWTLLNWVKFWAYNGKNDFVKLLEFHNSYKLSINTLAAMLTTPHINTDINEGRFIYKNYSVKQISTGKFQIKNEKFALMILTQLKDYPLSFRKNNRFIKSLIAVNNAFNPGKRDNIFAEYNHLRMQKIIKRYPEKFEVKASIIDFMRMIEDNYNIGISQQNRLRFF